ncbi:unnamed protein product [Cyclocybe aegerita]|uniref:PepSY domain-containing protein n=1 Tax=Cyclocybe aegerita TaxID=1973307 RepID=A0A8S0XID2_CYCAE|nr:unnamed protein product [Cyclocybe aegerita]
MFPGRPREFSTSPPAAIFPTSADRPMNPNNDKRAVAEVFSPEHRLQTFGNGIDIPPSSIRGGLKETAVSVVQEKLGLKEGEVIYTSGYSSDVADYAYLAQAHDNILFINAVANLAMKDGKLVTFGSSFVKTASSHPTIPVETAVSAAERMTRASYNGSPTKIEYLALSNGTVALVHVIQVQNDEAGVWLEVHVDAHTGEVHSAVDFVA